MRLPINQRHAQSVASRKPPLNSLNDHTLQKSHILHCTACKADSHPAQDASVHITRRQSVWTAIVAGLPLLQAAASQRLALAAEEVLHVGSGGAFTSIGKAVAAAPEGAMIRIAPGMYVERLVISKRVRIVADGSGPVTLSWSTKEPYQSAIESWGLHGASISGLTIRHGSPSVANNYAVFLQGSDLLLQDCDISSCTGSGIGVEGGSPLVARCAVHNCERHGAAIFSELGGSAGGGSFQDCRIYANKLNGILVRDGADPVLSGNDIRQNGASGMLLQGCSGRYKGNSIAGNGRGSVTIDALADVDVGSIELDNKLDKPMTLL